VHHSGFASDFDIQSADLAAGRSNVKNVTLLFDDRWGFGVAHAKAWITDKKDVYMGSANNDWKSHTQVHPPNEIPIHVLDQLVYSVGKQIGEYVPFLLLTLQVKEIKIYFASHPHIVKTMEIYFQNLWTLSTLNSTTYTKVA
jgi:phospholipase D3/4